MMLPYILDQIPEQLGRLFGKLAGWKPEGKLILLEVTESGDARLNGTVITGTLARITSISQQSSGHTGACAIVKLDASLNYRGREITWLFVDPRFSGHGVHRLLLTWSAVNVFPIDDEQSPNQIAWKDMIAICLMKLRRTDGLKPFP